MDLYHRQFASYSLQKNSSQNVIGTHRIWFDCSHTMCNGHRSGVQRTVRKLLDACMADERVGSCSKPIIAEGDDFYVADSTISYQIGLMRQDALGRMPRPYHFAAKWLCKKTGSSQLRKWLMPDPGHLGISKPYTVFRKKYLELRAKLDPKRQRVLVQPTAGDLVLLSDSYWERPRIWSALRNAKRNGARIAAVIYDLIPLRYPGFVPPEAEEKFRDYLNQTIELSDCLICISQSVQQDLREYIQRHHSSRTDVLQIHVFSLGCEIQPLQGAAVHPATKLFASGNPPHLMVATFDPHKNHDCVLSAFELLWQTNPNAKLCCIGARGSQSKTILDRIQSHPRFGKQLHTFHDVDDASLAYCYNHAQSVICPSFVEGFGLPIVESLHHGRRTLASDTAVHREIGRDHCEYFAPDAPDQLAELLLSDKAIALSKKYDLTSWQQSWQELLTAALAGKSSNCLSVEAA